MKTITWTSGNNNLALIHDIQQVVTVQCSVGRLCCEEFFGNKMVSF
jgi:hypothetical protein